MVYLPIYTTWDYNGAFHSINTPRWPCSPLSPSLSFKQKSSITLTLWLPSLLLLASNATFSSPQCISNYQPVEGEEPTASHLAQSHTLCFLNVSISHQEANLELEGSWQPTRHPALITIFIVSMYLCNPFLGEKLWMVGYSFPKLLYKSIRILQLLLGPPGTCFATPSVRCCSINQGQPLRKPCLWLG